jgi:hypothetical protein
VILLLWALSPVGQDRFKSVTTVAAYGMFSLFLLYLEKNFRRSSYDSLAQVPFPSWLLGGSAAQGRSAPPRLSSKTFGKIIKNSYLAQLESCTVGAFVAIINLISRSWPASFVGSSNESNQHMNWFHGRWFNKSVGTTIP